METMKLDEQPILSEAEVERVRLDLSRQVHDRAFARQVAAVPEAEWRTTENNLKRPRGGGSSYRFRVYVKGLVDKPGMAGGMGVAICDQDDGLVFEVSKGLNAKEHEGNAELAEVKALIEGLHIAVAVDLKKIKIVSDNPLLYQYVTGKKHPTKANVAVLANQMHLLLRKFTHVRASHVEEKDVKFAVELAKKAMALQFQKSLGHGNEMNITCAICFEKTDVHQTVLLTSCPHKYCYSCMSKHVQFKLLQGVLPKCPHQNCKSKLILDSCKKFLTPELFNTMSQRVKESSIPVEERIYCPYPRCSTLFSKAELQGSKGNSAAVTKQPGASATECPKCHGAFCVNCKVPWHANLSCFDYKKQNPYPSIEEKKLQSLATQNLWRQCPKCSNMVSLARDADMSFAINVEQNGETRNQPALVLSGTNAISSMTGIDIKIKVLIYYWHRTG
ncbi:UNVERIFIED_CONTAM: hypothetical protein Slati_0651100 [Sesamum latifolium]|uniref:RBR-type E3 ubiquitin transferase n=1 Tax=Sesamum latifolium TaxID=2727402 RepID=A0AAW2Y3D2_9LAMI